MLKQKQDINQTPDATDEEKLAANNQVDQALTDGIQQINNANGNNDVDNAKNNATQVINNVTVDVQKKPQAKQALSAKATENLMRLMLIMKVQMKKKLLLYKMSLMQK